MGVCSDYGPKVVVGIDATGIYINPRAEHAGVVGLIASLFIPGVGEERAATEIVAATKGEGVIAEFVAKLSGRATGPATDAAGNPIGRIVVNSRGNAMIEPVGGETVPAGKGGVDTHTLYPNGSNYQRLNPQGHANDPTPHAHGHEPGLGPNMKGQGDSLDVHGNVVPSNSAAAHWPIH